MSAVIYGEIPAVEIKPSDAELSARLSMKRELIDPLVGAALCELSRAARIKFASVRIRVIDVRGDEVFLEGTSVRSAALAAYFSGVRETYLFAVTLGSEVDRLIMKKRALSLTDGFVYDAVASAMAEAACDALEDRIHKGEKTKNRFSPGYGDSPLSLQKDVLALLSADKLVGIKLLESLLMTPMKSITAFAAIIE